MAGQYQGLVHQPAAVVGPPHSRILCLPLSGMRWPGCLSSNRVGCLLLQAGIVRALDDLSISMTLDTDCVDFDSGLFLRLGLSVLKCPSATPTLMQPV